MFVALQVLMSLNGWPPRITSNPRHWLDRAKKARDAAAAVSDPDFKRKILEVAAGYERLAERAEKRTLKLKADRRLKLRQMFRRRD